jgi:hypothetical protein
MRYVKATTTLLAFVRLVGDATNNIAGPNAKQTTIVLADVMGGVRDAFTKNIIAIVIVHHAHVRY